MKFRTKLLISLFFGLCAAFLCAGPPMWWGVLFAPITERLAASPLAADAAGWFSFQLGDTVYRLKSLDMIFAFFQ